MDRRTLAYLAMKTMAEIAVEAGEKEYAAMLHRYALGARSSYKHYAEMDTRRQAKLVRPLALGLLTGEKKKAVQRRLKKAVEDYRYRVGTGFLSTPFLLPVLTEAGESLSDAAKHRKTELARRSAGRRNDR